jgi:hypothetical protein
LVNKPARARGEQRDKGRERERVWSVCCWLAVVRIGLYVAFLPCHFAPSFLTQSAPFSIRMPGRSYLLPDACLVKPASECWVRQTSTGCWLAGSLFLFLQVPWFLI